jgi:hypothetical protein
MIFYSEEAIQSVLCCAFITIILVISTYENWEPAVEISCIGACSMANLVSQPEVMITAISMRDIIDQHRKEETGINYSTLA